MSARRLVSTLALAASLLPAAGRAAETTVFAAPGGETDRVRVHAATDLAAMKPLIRDFQSVRAGTAVEYVEYQSVDLFAQAQEECRAGRSSADLLISSSTDQLVRLANDGCAVPHASPTPSSLPDWTRWRNEVFGFTFEPGVIVYHRDLVPPEDVRRTRADLVAILRDKPDVYRGRVGIYDIEQAGIGYLLALYDSRGTTVYGRLLEALSRLSVVTRCCTSDLLGELTAGRISIGYNLLGSYAVAAVRQGAPLTIVVPRDFTIVLSRAVVVARHAASPGAAFSFLDYLLSPRGQATSARSSFFFSFDGPIPPEVDGPATLTASALLRPIEVGSELMFVQDRAKRARFTAEWRASMYNDRR